MGRWSLRGWLLTVSLLFAVLVVGGISLTTYVIVTEGMQMAAVDTTERIASVMHGILDEASIDAERLAAAKGLEGSELYTAATEGLVLRLPEYLAGGRLSSSEFALYGPNDQLIWSSHESAAQIDLEQDRRAVYEGRARTQTLTRGDRPLTGLVTNANLGSVIVHVPADLPGGETGALVVVYRPTSEERVIDSIRAPMAVLAVSAMFIMVVLMQTSMSWVLKLVDDLRRAADSIYAGRLDERLPESGDNEVSELAKSINKVIERLHRRAEAQARFVADASHELATPVAGIRGYTSILRAWGSEDETLRSEAIEAIDRESKRMARLTSNLLSLLHADEGVRLKSERLDVNFIARERIAATASRYLDKDLEFIGPGDAPQNMVGDPDRIDDVLSILLDNAAKYTPPGGRVSLTTRRAREQVTIQVTDTGKGIPPEDLPRIFDRFFRSDMARTSDEGGFGLGLSIAKSIVTSMNGHIEASSVPGEGTTFSVVLPRGRI